MRVKILLISFLVSYVSLGQTPKDTIRYAFYDYFEFVQSKNNKKIVDLLYPRLFEYYSKLDMVEALNKQDSLSKFRYNFLSPKIRSISKIEKWDGISYCFLKYNFRIVISFKDVEPMDVKTANQLEIMLNKKYGKRNVKYVKEEQAFIIKMKSAMYLIRNPIYVGWKVLERKDEEREFFDALIPKAIQDKLN